MIEDSRTKMARFIALQGLVDYMYQGVLRYGDDREKVNKYVIQRLEKLGFQNGRYLIKEFPDLAGPRFEAELRKLSTVYVEIMEVVKMSLLKEEYDHGDDK